MSVDEFRLFLGSCYQAVLRHIQDAIDPPPPLMSQQECLFELSRLNSIMEGWKGEAQSPLGTAESRRAAEAKFWDLYGEYQGVLAIYEKNYVHPKAEAEVSQEEQRVEGEWRRSEQQIICEGTDNGQKVKTD